MSDELLRAAERRADEASDDGPALEALDRMQARSGQRRIRDALGERLAIALRAALEHRLRRVYVKTYVSIYAMLTRAYPPTDLTQLASDVREEWRARGSTTSLVYEQPAVDELLRAGIPLEVMGTFAAVTDAIGQAHAGPALTLEPLADAAGRAAERIVRLALHETRDAGPRGREAFGELARLVGFQAALVLSGCARADMRGAAGRYPRVAPETLRRVENDIADAMYAALPPQSQPTIEVSPCPECGGPRALTPWNFYECRRCRSQMIRVALDRLDVRRPEADR